MSDSEYYSEDFDLYFDGKKIVARKVTGYNEYWIKLDDGSWHHIAITEHDKL